MTNATLTAVAKAKSRRDRARDEFHAAIRRASEDGHSLRQIARFAGVTHTRVRQIIRDE